MALDVSILDNFKAGNRTNCVHTQEMSPNKKWAYSFQFKNWMEAIQTSPPVLLEKNLASCRAGALVLGVVKRVQREDILGPELATGMKPR